MKYKSLRSDKTGGTLEYVALKGSERKELPAGSRRIGPADPDRITTVTVQVRSRARPDELDNMFNQMAQQPINQRKYLSRAVDTTVWRKRKGPGCGGELRG